MLKLSGLIPALADVLGVPQQTVAIYARHLREARLISTGGRGPGGAEMTPRDCANLVIAVVGSDMAKDAAATVSMYSSLPAWRWHMERARWRLEHMPVPRLTALAEGHSFGEALEALFDSARDGTLQAAMKEASRLVGDNDSPRVDFELAGPIPAVNVTIPGHYLETTYNWREEIFYCEAPPADMFTPSKEIDEWNDRVAEKYHPGDLMITRHFTSYTIVRIGELLTSR